MSWEIIRWIDGSGRVQMCSSKEVAERLLSTYPEEEQKNYHIREYRQSKVFVPPGECMNTDKEENRKMREKISEYETCVRCGKETKYKKSDHIDHRYGYIEGAGQLCFMCSQTRKMHKQGAYE